MDDWEASFSRKFREMIRALQLERIYTKKQILEFYLNQFHVVGNGNGIGIAAKYYFNKDVREYGSGNAGATNTFRVLGKKARPEPYVL